MAAGGRFAKLRDWDYAGAAKCGLINSEMFSAAGRAIESARRAGQDHRLGSIINEGRPSAPRCGG
jgi:hypothetical protein